MKGFKTPHKYTASEVSDTFKTPAFCLVSSFKNSGHNSDHNSDTSPASSSSLLSETPSETPSETRSKTQSETQLEIQSESESQPEIWQEIYTPPIAKPTKLHSAKALSNKRKAQHLATAKLTRVSDELNALADSLRYLNPLLAEVLDEAWDATEAAIEMLEGDRGW
ncbi:MAG TPA: hypothetical protein V6C65_16600, partial [Allocoleopsis sp.]